jgi:hypothetical protein
MISVLSLVVAILAVFFGPLVARANVQRQIRATAREAWMREFREKVAMFLIQSLAMRGHQKARDLPITDPAGKAAHESLLALEQCFYVIHLLIQERGIQHQKFLPPLSNLHNKALSGEPRASEAAVLQSVAGIILQRERSAIEVPGRWRSWLRHRLGAVKQWRPWSQLRAWLRRDPPRFPN